MAAQVAAAKAEELLADPTRGRTAIANLCGYSSANALANFLRRNRQAAHSTMRSRAKVRKNDTIITSAAST